MLTITDTAADALDSIVAATPDTPEQAGLRIAPAAGENGQPGFSLALTAAPVDGDQVVPGHDTPVYVAAESAQELDDKILDAEVDGDQVGFMLMQR